MTSLSFHRSDSGTNSNNWHIGRTALRLPTVACTKQSASNPVFRHAKYCSGLLHRFPNVAEDNHRPQRRAQPSHLLGESRDGLLFCQGLFRIKSWTRQPVEHVPLVVTRHAPDGKLWSPAPLAEQVDCFIDKDSCQPATEGAVVVELLKIANRAEQAVLHDVLSIFPAS
jgi:hypothetical protein